MRPGDYVALDRAMRRGERHELLERAAARRGRRFGRRGGGAPPPAYDPRTVFRSVYDAGSPGGFVDDVGTFGGNDLTANGAPTFSAADASMGGRPSVTLSGTAQSYTRASMSMGGSVSALTILIVQYLGAFGAGDFWIQYAAGGVELRLRVIGGPLAQMTGSGDPGITASTSTTNIVGCRLIGFDFQAGGNNRVFYRGAAEDTDANTAVALANNGVLTIGDASGGGADIAASFGHVAIIPAILTAPQLAAHAAWATAYFGAGVGL